MKPEKASIFRKIREALPKVRNVPAPPANSKEFSRSHHM